MVLLCFSLSLLSISPADDNLMSWQENSPPCNLTSATACAFIQYFFFLNVSRSFFFCLYLPLSHPSQIESPVSTPAPPPLHLLSTVGNSEIASPCEQIMVRTRSVAVNTSDVALATEPECLGPCEPGTSVNLEGIVWQETEDGK